MNKTIIHAFDLIYELIILSLKLIAMLGGIYMGCIALDWNFALEPFAIALMIAFILKITVANFKKD